MKNKVQVLILSGYGINCENETALAFEQQGAEVKIIHINDLITNKFSWENYQILAFPGGFSYGDHTGAGKAMANKIKHNLQVELQKFIQRDTLTIGLCNGFQIMTNLGIFNDFSQEKTTENLSIALTKNSSNAYQCEWVKIKNMQPNSPWTKGIDEMEIPIAHGEGNFFTTENGLEKLKNNKQITWKYIDRNPNGSIDDIAGISDKSGRIMGMMPHPERFLFGCNHPEWTKNKISQENFSKVGAGQKIFANAINYFN